MNWVGRGVELGGSTDENLTRPFFCCSNSIFGAPLCPGSEISTTFFASTQFLEHPFVWDQRFRRPFFAPTQFSEHPFVRDQIFRRHFLFQLSFWSTPLSFDQRFRRPFSKLNWGGKNLTPRGLNFLWNWGGRHSELGGLNPPTPIKFGPALYYTVLYCTVLYCTVPVHG